MLNNKISKAVRLAIAFGAVSVTATSAVAAEGEESIEKIEITGSAIKRTDMEGALPVQVIGRDFIDQSGFASVPDLLQSLPSMQGFTTPADSVGGGGGGTATASLRDIGAEYTLVLLNGRRTAPLGSGSAVDLNTIPLAMIERVEILTDGASALYGSDAIAGVVNFILRDEVDQTTVNARYYQPQESGGGSYTASIVTGFGDLDEDGFSLSLGYSFDSKEQLKSAERDFAKTGILSFQHDGQEKYLLASSSNAIPGNVRVRHLPYNDDGTPVLNDKGEHNTTFAAFNPYFEKNGECAPDNAPNGNFCEYDFTKTLEIYPESERHSFVANFNFEVTEDIQLYSELTATDYSQISRIAPYPTGEFEIALDSDLANEYVHPYLPGKLNEHELATVDSIRPRWRALAGGNRITNWESDSYHFVVGSKGYIFDLIDYDTYFTVSKNKRTQTYVDGWPLSSAFVPALEAGQINIFETPDNFDDPERAKIVQDTMYKGHYMTNEIEMKAFNFKGSLPVFELPAGTVYAAFGVDVRDYEYTSTNDENTRNGQILFENPRTDYAFSRDNLGVFTEFAIPVLDNLELSAALRYDEVSEVDGQSIIYASGSGLSRDNVPGGPVGVKMDDTTYKLSFRYQATEDLLVRGSYGTGFKAPSILEIARPLVNFGVTSGSYKCELGNHPLAYLCQDGEAQYENFVSGNAELVPETSTQSTIGFVYSPSTDFGVTIDYFEIELENKVSEVSEAQIFADPVKHANLFRTRFNPGTGDTELAIIERALNIGQEINRGVDYSFELKNDLSFGTLNTKLSGTYFIERRYTDPGTDGSNPSDWLTSMGQFGTNDEVTFRNMLSLSNTLSHGDFVHTFNYRWRSGYLDQRQNEGTSCLVRVGKPTDPVVCADTIQLRVPSVGYMDYQTTYLGFENTSITFGINNLFDKQPPLSLRRAGSGHQVGYDPRYTDVYGRTFYVNATYSF
ncbi:TonB-dependent receptor [Pseudoalteromonas luteoviolacea]|uniref:TonB-dependent receptor domain-containing protein n=1 Tax=Pseudoalteromonas luteoviolacea TaxID=43657 RepID=UPI001F252D56|nr:TonB-dependent receptor [Pseudoalteromonas luteoviolacea]MCF6438240.1 TonB-dependent receptor [Pseudoalteromonas luteoviolacea]